MTLVPFWRQWPWHFDDYFALTSDCKNPCLSLSSAERYVWSRRWYDWPTHRAQFCFSHGNWKGKEVWEWRGIKLVGGVLWEFHKYIRSYVNILFVHKKNTQFYGLLLQLVRKSCVHDVIPFLGYFSKRISLVGKSLMVRGHRCIT